MHREGLQPAAHGSVRARKETAAHAVGDIPKAEVDTGRLNLPVWDRRV